MFKIQCDKNLKRMLERFFKTLYIDADVSGFSKEKADIILLRSKDDLRDFSSTPSYIVVNSDDKELLKMLSGTKSKIVTCGFSTRSTATLSSTSDSMCAVCLQRSVKNLLGEKLPPLEFSVERTGAVFDEVSVLMIITAALLCGVKVSQLNKIHL